MPMPASNQVEDQGEPQEPFPAPQSSGSRAEAYNPGRGKKGNPPPPSKSPAEPAGGEKQRPRHEAWLGASAQEQEAAILPGKNIQKEASEAHQPSTQKAANLLHPSKGKGKGKK